MHAKSLPYSILNLVRIFRPSLAGNNLVLAAGSFSLVLETVSGRGRVIRFTQLKSSERAPYCMLPHHTAPVWQHALCITSTRSHRDQMEHYLSL